MNNPSINHVGIRGVASCVPHKEIDNLTATNFSAEESAKVISSTGVHKRRVVNKQCASDLCFFAAEQLLTELVCDPHSIDILIFVSQTPDYVLPSTACILQHRLGLSHKTMAFDINLGCSGYTYGLIVLAQMLSTGVFKKGLLLAGDTISKLVSEQDRSVAFLFGDAGSATLLEYDQDAAPLFFDYGTDGSEYDKLIVEAGAFRVKADEKTQRRISCEAGFRAKTELFMNGADIFSFTLREVPKTIMQALALANWRASDIDYFVFHQANEFMLKHLIKKRQLDSAKALMSLSTFGNTSVASIPLTLCHHAVSFKSDVASKILLSGFGVGFSWATIACVLHKTLILPVIILDASIDKGFL